MRIVLLTSLSLLVWCSVQCASMPAIRSTADFAAEEKALGDEPRGWEGERDRYGRVRAWLGNRTSPTAATYRRSPSELWVYDARPEMGIGMHQASPEHMDMARRLGLRFVRHTMYWHTMENTTTPGKYDPKYLEYWDKLTRSAREHGVELVVVIHGNAPGVSWQNRREGYRRFARFAGDMARRYPQVRYWELWNEMNVAFTDLFGAGVPGEEGVNGGKAYAEMLKLAYPAVKKANPRSWVVFGGLAWDWRPFLQGVYEAGGRDYFDVMNLHSYGVPAVWGVVTRSVVCRQLMRKHGDEGKPLWITEFGIDAGNVASAWGYAHDSGRSDAEYFDTKHMDEWKACIGDIRRMGLYQKYLPYQLDALNESGPAELRTTEYSGKYLPSGMTIDDFGFGILRKDGKTPRPTYSWLLQEQVNKEVLSSATRTLDLTIAYDGYVPVGYKYQIRNGKLTIKDVRVSSSEPKVLRLVKDTLSNRSSHQF